ncbi:MAG: 1,2-phenylacetyl-CoA epoxidase subunit PaaD [Terriglobia bacterium]
MALSSEDAWQVLATIEDPEIPALSILDLGIVRCVEMEGGDLRVTLTPTYAACPALKVIESKAASALEERGFQRVRIEITLSAPWTPDDVTDAGRRKLEEAGIAPPPKRTGTGNVDSDKVAIRCPLCGSVRTSTRSEFGSTLCKSLRYCADCHQAFEYFKELR